ncbi:MAG: class I SAM-dependent methyltransferase [Anaerolineales bacterium]|jgi:SAM-dependent methyltransferase|nr:class I SAM-dependent methyltransferase [Anaerolineales bacterium]
MYTIKTLPALYQELADWWPLLSSPEDYAEEAGFYQRALLAACAFIPRTLLELGSGGGNNASHLKQRFQMTLVDISPNMLRVSQELNPECEHVQDDMRKVRLGRQFDAVFIHDAIVYMASISDLTSAIETAFIHCKPGGVALFAPDCIRETFKASTSHGGHDRGNRSLRYLEWTWDPDPTDTTYIFDMVYVLREGTAEVRCVHRSPYLWSVRSR